MLPSARPWNSTWKLLASASMALYLPFIRSPVCMGDRGCVNLERLLVEADVLDEGDFAAVVLDDVITAQTVAGLIEIVDALDTIPVFQADDDVADAFRLRIL